LDLEIGTEIGTARLRLLFPLFLPVSHVSEIFARSEIDPLELLVAVPPPPACPLHHCHDAADLHLGRTGLSIRGDVQAWFAEQLGHAGIGSAAQEVADDGFAAVGFEAFRGFGFGLGFCRGIEPPGFVAGSAAVDGFGPELVAFGGQVGDIHSAIVLPAYGAFDAPESSVAGLVAEVA